MSRKLAREIVMKKLYQNEFECEYHIDSMTEEERELIDVDKYRDYMESLLKGALEKQEEIDKKIEENSKKAWKLSRLPKVDLSILRVALYEILYMEDIPEKVSINEAVELAKKYSTEESSKFINGLLGGVVKKESGSSD